MWIPLGGVISPVYKLNTQAVASLLFVSVTEVDVLDQLTRYRVPTCMDYFEKVWLQISIVMTSGTYLPIALNMWDKIISLKIILNVYVFI
jgi:hypothetical protein